MIIAVNTRLLIREKIEGIGRFALETLKIITREHPEHRFIFIFDRKFTDEFIFSSNITPVVAFPQARHPLLWYWFFEHGIPPLLRKYKADLFFSPDGWLSLRTPVVSLPVIHDLNFMHFPEFIPYHVRMYYYHFFPQFVNKSQRIATVSEFTKKDIEYTYGFKQEKIDVVYNGASGFVPVGATVRKQVQDQYAQGAPFFVAVGLIHPRKNLANLFLAYDLFRKESQTNIRLIVAGSKKWWTDDMQNALEGCMFRDDIHFTGRVSDDDLKRIVASALGMVYVSFFEGFGIPVLEAMHCDTPVICSSTSSLPEVGGDAVVYADPADVESIKSAMIKLYRDPDLRNKIITKARIRRELFSWNKTADLLWGSMEKCLRFDV